MKGAYGDDTMPSTAENVAQEWQVSREDQDAFAVRSQDKASRAQESGRFAAESCPSPSRSERATRSWSTATSTPENQRRSAGQAQADRPPRRHRDGRQRVRRQ
jgi:acetyl-CoA acetyltransferase